jgi:hypothetical protein
MKCTTLFMGLHRSHWFPKNWPSSKRYNYSLIWFDNNFVLSHRCWTVHRVVCKTSDTVWGNFPLIRIAIWSTYCDIPGNVVPLLRNGQGKHSYIRGNERNEYVQLLQPRQRLAKRGIDPLLCNVRAQQRFPKQRRCCCDNHGWIVKTIYKLRREVSQLSASLRGERTSREVIC